MKRLSINGRVGGIEPGDTDAVRQAEREFRTKLNIQELNRMLALANAARPPGAAKIAGAFRATTPRGNLLRDPNELAPEQLEQLRKGAAGVSQATMAGAASSRAEAAGEEGAQAYRSQAEIIEGLGDVWVKARQKGRNAQAWEDVMRGIMNNLSVLAPDAESLPAMITLVRSIDRIEQKADDGDEKDPDKRGDIRSWLLGE